MSIPEDRTVLAEQILTEFDPISQEQQPIDRGGLRWPKYAFALLLLGAGILAGRSLPALRSQTSAPVAVTATPVSFPPTAVETIAISPGNGARQVRLIGQVESRISTTIRPRTEGTVRDFLVQPGDTVQAGTLLAVLDDADQQLSLSRARADLAEAESELARLETGTRPEVIARYRAALQAARALELEALDNLERTQSLVAEGALARRLFVEARAQADAARGIRLEAEATLAEAVAGPRIEEIAAQRAVVAANRAAVAQAQLNLERTEIRAAESGVIQSRLASSGDYLEIGTPILTVVGGNTLDIFLEVPEELSREVEVGMPVTLASRALPDWQLQAPIAAIIPMADSASRQQRVRVQLDNPPADLVPGMAIQGEIAFPVAAGFVVPRDALTPRGDRWAVFVVGDDGTVQELEVDLLADMGERVTIAHPDLQSGQTLVVQGGDGLRDGAPVRPLPRQSANS